MNNTINRMKKRADILTEYIVERVERLEEVNRYLEQLNRDGNASFNEMCVRLHGYSMPFNKVLDSVDSIIKDKSGLISVHFKNNLIGEFDTDNCLYPIISRLYEIYAEKVEYEKKCAKKMYQLKKGSLNTFLPPLDE